MHLRRLRELCVGQPTDKVCTLIWEPLEWDATREDASTGDDQLKAFKERSAKLETEDLLEGKLWRWQQEAGRRIGKNMFRARKFSR